jgi:hypothetical protein
MSDKDSKSLLIYTIVINPRTKDYAQYTINESQIHTMRYDKLYEYLISLVPEKILEINILIGEKVPFLVLVQDKQVIKLNIDKEKELNEYKEKYFNKNFNSLTMKNPIFEERKEDKYLERADKLIDKISKINFK